MHDAQNHVSSHDWNFESSALRGPFLDVRGTFRLLLPRARLPRDFARGGAPRWPARRLVRQA